MNQKDCEQQDKVIMFTDIHMFARLFETNDPRMVDFIQTFYEVSGDHIVGHGGQIIKYIGDAILAVFPADGTVKAVACAKAMRSSYRALLERFDLNRESELEVGVGAGTVFVGTFGHESRRSLDVLGEAVMETAMCMHYRGIAEEKDLWTYRSRDAITSIPLMTDRLVIVVDHSGYLSAILR